MGLFYGIFVPIPFYIIHKYWPKLRADYINTFVICNWLGWLSVGINTSLLPYFLFGFFAQWLKRYKAVWYAKWHLTTVAAIAGGMSYSCSCLATIFPNLRLDVRLANCTYLSQGRRSSSSF